MSAPAGNPYETPRLLAEYLLFHYGTEQEVLPWESGPREALEFARRSVTELLDASCLPADARALDLGCAVGRSCYELAAVCAEVVGVDFSQSFVDAAEQIRRNGALTYARTDEGAHTTELVACRPAGGGSGRIRFEQGDAMDLRAGLGAGVRPHAVEVAQQPHRPLVPRGGGRRQGSA